MKVAFIQFLYFEYLGIMYLASSLKKRGHDAEVFIFPPDGRSEAFIDDIVRFKPDILAFSVMSGTENEAVRLAQRMKKRLTAYTVFGGPHPTVVPDIITQDGLDCVCIGEAEKALAAIADSLAAGELPRTIPGTWCKVSGSIVRNDIGILVEDLATLPRPDRSLYRSKYPFLQNRRASVMTGRGCPYQCSFCSNPALIRLYRGKGAYVRQRTVADVIDEIREIRREHDVRRIYFEDDTFNLNREWVLAFCESYRREIGLPFSCHIRADIASDDVIAALARANCRIVSFGVETGSRQTRRLLLNKDVTDEQIAACAALLKKHGIRFRTLNILGLPGETLDDAWQTVVINARIRPDYPWCAIFQPLPATALWDHCTEHALFRDGALRTHATFFKDSPLAIRNRDEIVNLHKLFFLAVKFPALHRFIRPALRARPNKAYELLFALGHAWVFFRSSMLSAGDLLLLGLRNFSRYLPRGAEPGTCANPSNREIKHSPST